LLFKYHFLVFRILHAVSKDDLAGLAGLYFKIPCDLTGGVVMISPGKLKSLNSDAAVLWQGYLVTQPDCCSIALIVADRDQER